LNANYRSRNAESRELIAEKREIIILSGGILNIRGKRAYRLDYYLSKNL
jgi:hypothetical protein